MAGEDAMTKPLPTNDELYRWICLNEQPPKSGQFLPGQISSYRAHWRDLKRFCEQRNLLEHGFKGALSTNFHQRFWELYLSKAFDAAGIALNRGKKGQPDFYFERDGQKVWIEAVACGEPQKEQNKVPPPGDDFESGLNSSYENQTMQRMASVISGKIKQFQKYKDNKVVTSNDICIIALNGWRALNGHPDAVVPNAPPMIFRVLFGVGDLILSRKSLDASPTYSHKRIKMSKNNAPLAHFIEPQNIGIAGVLYSTTNILETRRDILGHDFIFIPNPVSPHAIPSILSPIVELQKTSRKNLWSTAI